MKPSRFAGRSVALAVAAATAAFGAPGTALAQTSIRPGDRVSVIVYNHPELSTQATVTSDGDLALPVAGELHVAGIDSTEAASRITARLARVMRTPSVLVRVVGQGGNVFFTGAVVGTMPFSPGERLVSAIGDFLAKSNPTTGAAAGPALAAALDLRSVSVERGATSLGTFDIETLGRTGQAGPVLEPGDLVALADKPVRVDVRGDVKSPGPVYLYPGETLAQAVDEAGSFSPTTSLTGVVLHRDGADRTVSSAGLEFTSAAHDGDAVTLRPAPHVNVLGMVNTPGEIVLKNDLSLLSALYAAGGPTRFADLRHVEIVEHGVARFVNASDLAHGNLQSNASLADGDVVFVPEGHKFDVLPVLQSIGVLRQLL